jgi:FMN phosphatase YigB (HAD superfamily)
MDRASQKHERVFSEIVYFGDAVWDVKATENLGWQFIGIGGKVADGFIDYRNPEEILKRLC